MSGLTWTPTDADLAPNKLYYWRVVAFAGANNTGASSESSAWYFTTTAGALVPPELLSPWNGATDVSTNPELRWDGVADATYYDFECSASQPFPGYVYTTNNTYATPPTGLSPATTYYWHVRSLSATSHGSWSSTWSFTTSPIRTPGVPTLSLPADGATDISTNPTLQWNTTSNATHYQVQVAPSSSFASPLVDATVSSGTSHSLAGLGNNTAYYWRVRAYNSTTPGSWSATRFFVTVNLWPNQPDWPNGTATNINSPFGPRDAGSDAAGWFHTGIDMGNGNLFVAPYNMILREKNVGATYMRLAFQCQESGIAPMYVQFQELDRNDQGLFTENVTTFNRGQQLPTNGDEGNYVHMEMWPGGLWTKGQYAQCQLASQNPLHFLPHDEYFGHVSVDVGIGDGIWPNEGCTYNPWPLMDGTRRCFEVRVRSDRPDFTLNTISITLTSSTGGYTTANFLENPLAANINFDAGLAVQRDNGTVVVNQPCPRLGAGTFRCKEKDGVKIFGEPFAPGAGYKRLLFRYYLCADPAIQPTEVHVVFYDSRGYALGLPTDWRFPQTCVECPTEGPEPPGWLSATPVADGVRLQWNPSPDAAEGLVLYYSLYRRADNSTESPQSIAVVPATTLSYDDLVTRPANTLVPGHTYLYSVASIGDREEGCNGPPKPGCTGPNCPLSCVDEKAATVPTLPAVLIYEGKTVYAQVPDVKALYDVIARNDLITTGANIKIVGGHSVTVGPNVTVDYGTQTTIQVDPNVQ